MKMKKTYLSAVAVLVCAALVGGIAGTSFYTKRHFKEDIVTGPNVTEVFKLSRYNPNLEGTIGDSDVYVLKGEKRGRFPCCSGQHSCQRTFWSYGRHYSGRECKG